MSTSSAVLGINKQQGH